MLASQPSGPGVGSHLTSMKADGSRLFIHTADVRGRFITRRRILFTVLIAIYLALPLVHIGGHPAMHLDVAARRFYLFGGTFNAQDFWRMLFVLTTVGFSLLFVTAWRGRVWCGWACPQTVFLEGVFRPIERFFDGPRERRIREQGAPWTAGKVARTVGKHATYLAVSSFIAHAALSLFLSTKDLAGMISEGPANHLTPFIWSVVVTGILYFNFSWFREQLCVVICPYGRLQSAMHDRDSIIIGYDAGRGEPRGRMLKVAQPEAPQGAPAAAEQRRGDCVDCRKCVAVCPTGIDIRNGLQLECLACTQCIDACDEVMDKLGKPRGLIRYDSLPGLQGQPRRVLRPRLILYGTLLAAAVTALTLSLVTRTPFEYNLLRFPGLPYVLEGTRIRNQLEVHLVNKNPTESTFQVKIEAPAGVEVVVSKPEVKLGSLEEVRIPLVLIAERGKQALPFTFQLEVVDGASGEVRRKEERFLAPPGMK